MVKKRTATYCDLVRELLYSETQLTKSPWDSGSRIDRINSVYILYDPA